MVSARKSNDRTLRRALVISGVAGLGANLVLSLAVMWVAWQRWVPVPLHGVEALAALLLCLAMMCFDTPIMVLSLRKLATDRKGPSSALLMATNGFYVFFAAVYAGLATLLTGWTAEGTGLSALGVLRFASALLFVR